MNMAINPQQTPEERKTEILRHISLSLQSIATNIGHEIGPFKVQEAKTMIEQMQPELDKQAEANRREEEIDELKKSNRIAERTAKLAVYGLIASVIVGAAGFLIQLSQLRFEKMRYQEDKDAQLIEASVISDTQPVQATISSQLPSHILE